MVILAWLILSIILHELGHFGLAKFLRVPVLEFSIGSGPLLFRKLFGRTEVSLRLIPIKGHISIPGPFAKDFPYYARSGRTSDLLRQSTTNQERLIVAAGPIMTLVLALLGWKFEIQHLALINAFLFAMAALGGDGQFLFRSFFSRLPTAK